MHYRNLGRTNLRVSEVGFGGWAIGGNAYGNVNDQDSLAALESAREAGVNFFDTADTYGEGRSESLLGKFFKNKPRNDFIVASKVGWDFCGKREALPGAASKVNHVGHQKNFDPNYIRFACEQSLVRLGVETIDLYQLHNPALELIQKGEIVGVLETLKKQGGTIGRLRPGRRTSEYLNSVLRRITLAGAVFLGAVSVLPWLVNLILSLFGVSTGGYGSGMIISSSGLLIAVGVVLDTMKQLEAQLRMRHYEGFIK